jgi:DNA-binding SARP family transcriptional activator
VTLRIKLFGPLVVESDDRVLGLRDFGGAKPKQLFEILVLARGAAVTKERLADLLWGDNGPRNVAATLETYVSVLRNRLQPGVPRDESVLVTEPGAYRFDTSRVELDLDRFDALVASPDRTRLDEALAVASGEVVADEPYADWAVALRDRYQGRRVEALLEAGELALAEGDLPAALARADEAVAADALSERACRMAMRAAYGLGRQEDALRRYERCAAALMAQLGVQPMDETSALALAIRRHELAAPVVAGAMPSMLLGRDEEMRAALDLIAAVFASERLAALVLIEGETGVGKSRLLDEIVARLPESVRIGRSRCFELERDLPYVPVVAAVRDAVGMDGDVDGLDSSSRLRVLDSLVSVTRDAAPVVLVIDDLHWADTATVASLGYVARRCADRPVIVLGAYRSEAADVGHPLRMLEPTLRWRLEALTREELAGIGPKGLFGATGGLPLFVSWWLESKLADGDPVPLGLQEAILARCHAGGAYGFQVLLSASGLASPFTVDDVAEALCDPRARVVREMERLVTARLFDATGDRFTFRYPLVRQVLLDSLTPARRRLVVSG